MSDSEGGKSRVYDDDVQANGGLAGWIAATWARYDGCNLDQGNPIPHAKTIFDDDVKWNIDCLAAGDCDDNGEYGLHNMSAHECGHWYWMADVDDDANDPYDDWEALMTMEGRIFAGETNPRDLHAHDIDAARVMDGYRSEARIDDAFAP